MFIYQIGNEVICGIAEHTSNLKWRGDDQQSSQFSLVSFTNRYSIPETTEIRLKGILNIKKDSDPVSKLHAFIKMGGMPYIDVIGYLPSGMHNAPYCEAPNDAQTNYFFHTYGMITSVDREYVLDLDDDNQLVTMQLNLEMKINPYWTPLNRYMWFPFFNEEIPDNFELGNVVTTSVADFDWYISYYDEQAIEGHNIITNKPYYLTPTGVIDWNFRPKFTFYKNQTFNENLLYSSFYFPEWCKYSEQGIGFKSGTDLTTYVVSNPFSGDIKYVHVFEFLNSSMTINMNVTAEIAPNDIKSFNSSLNCNTLHNILLQPEFGGLGLVSSYQVIVGNDEIASCYVLNGYNEIIKSSITGQVLIPEWSYQTRLPCELFGIKNKITINNGEPRSYKYGALILNRAL